MKVLQINCVYPKGSTGKLTKILHDGIQKNDIESVVIYGRGEKINISGVHYVCGDIFGKINHFISNITGLMYGGCNASTERIKNIIKDENPDVVHLQCINGYFVNIYRLISWLKESEIPTVITLHAEFMYTANCGYAYDCNKWTEGCGNCPRLKKETGSIFIDNTALSFKKMDKAFDGFCDKLKIVSVSQWLLERARCSPILRNKNHLCIYNGIDTDIFRRYTDDEIKRKFCPNGEKMIFHVTPCFSNQIDHRKGGIWLLRLAERMEKENVRFVVAGENSVKGIIPENVIILGNISDQQELAKLYSAADVTIMLSKKETFSMVVAESLCCGTPVVGFEAGAPEQISIKEYSDFYSQGDIDGLKQGIEKWIFKEKIDKDVISQKAMNVYSTEKMVEKYLSVYRSFK